MRQVFVAASHTESRSASLHGFTGLRNARGTFSELTGWRNGSVVELQSFHVRQGTGSTVNGVQVPASHTQV